MNSNTPAHVKERNKLEDIQSPYKRERGRREAWTGDIIRSADYKQKLQITQS